MPRSNAPMVFEFLIKLMHWMIADQLTTKLKVMAMVIDIGVVSKNTSSRSAPVSVANELSNFCENIVKCKDEKIINATFNDVSISENAETVIIGIAADLVQMTIPMLAKEPRAKERQVIVPTNTEVKKSEFSIPFSGEA